MSDGGKIMVLGDVHAEFGKLNALVNRKKPDIVLQCGDFGYWPRLSAKALRRKRLTVPKMGDANLYWADGNHEDHWSLKSRNGNEVFKNVFHMRRGSTLMLPDGRTVMFIGGAVSTDKEWRTTGYDWFPDEAITTQDVRDIPEAKVDVVISHTCPREFEILGDDMTRPDDSRLALSYVLHRFMPKLWYFGHFHYHIRGRYKDCNWVGLTMAGCAHWWTWLPRNNDE